MEKILSPAQMLVKVTLERDIARLEGQLTVGNYFDFIDIINQKKAQLAALQNT